jgi:hypothetical protein
MDPAGDYILVDLAGDLGPLVDLNNEIQDQIWVDLKWRFVSVSCAFRWWMFGPGLRLKLHNFVLKMCQRVDFDRAPDTYLSHV